MEEMDGLNVEGQVNETRRQGDDSHLVGLLLGVETNDAEGENENNWDNNNELMEDEIASGSRGDNGKQKEANEKEKENEEKRKEMVIDLPFASRPCPTCLENENGTFIATDIKGQVRHVNEYHKDDAIVFRCAKCGKRYVKLHSAECHIPKCPGPQILDLPFKCSLCERAFSKRVGLSQHSRHAHPAERNQARLAPVGSGESTSRSTVFTEDEILLMLSMEGSLHGQQQIAKQMSRVLTAKTSKQLRDKRKDPRYKKRLEEYLKEKGIITQELQVQMDDCTSASDLSENELVINTDENENLRRIEVRANNDNENENVNEDVIENININLSENENENLDLNLNLNLNSSIDSNRKSNGINNGDEGININEGSNANGIDGRLNHLSIPFASRVGPVDEVSSAEEVDWRLSVLRTAYSLRPISDRVDGGLPSRVEEVVQGLRSCIDAVRGSDASSYQAAVDTATGLVINYINVSGNSSSGNRKGKNLLTHSGDRRKGACKRPRRKYIYARTQKLYKESPGLLAKYIRENIDWLNGSDQAEGGVSIRRIGEFYADLWNHTSPTEVPQWERPRECLPLSLVLSHITTKEIQGRISRLAGKVAPGPDGIRKQHLRGKFTSTILQILFNLILATGTQPSQWKMNRTTLILKDGKGGGDVGDYRPITVGSLLSRIYWGIIDQKLRSVLHVSYRQKGFTSESGCFNNIHILNEILRNSKVSKNGLVAVLLDISKAFDTVPHEAIEPALRRKGLPEFVIRMMANSYENVYTTISQGGESTSINLKRGIKQGDPISPLLFNLVFEPLLDSLESLQGYRIDENTSISCLAFADDITLTANSKDEMKLLLGCVMDFLESLGMTLSVGKCLCFQIIPTRDSWGVVDPALEISSGNRVPFIGADGALRYLGIKLSPWTGVDISGLQDALYTSCMRVKKLSLKPHQKVNLISTYLVPHYMYALSIAVPGLTKIRDIDKMLRVVVKEIYHLPQSTPNGLIYCGKRDGGLGFPKLEILSTSSILRTGLKFIQSPDPVMQSLANRGGMVARLKSVANSARLNWPLASFNDVIDFKVRAKKSELENWSKCVALGRGVMSFADDPLGNSWLYNPELLKPCRFLTALKLRGNVAGDRVSLKRAKVIQDSSCRKCVTKTESLAHILGQCTHTKGLRIRRHDEIRDLIIKEAGSSDPTLAIMKEPSFVTSSGVRLKPDLVLQSQEGVRVVDVTVRYEDDDYLERGRIEKIQKYQQLFPLLAERFNTQNISVKPVVVGARGAMPKETVEALKEINIINKKILKTISLIALRSSLETYHQFLDYGTSRALGSSNSNFNILNRTKEH